MNPARAVFSVMLLAAIAAACALVLAMLPPSAEAEKAEVARAQTLLRTELESRFEASPDPERTLVRYQTPVAADVTVGQPLADMRIPAFGPGWRWVALEGTSQDVLANGPGHYAWSPLPGAVGNVAFAAHRAGHGDPFIDFDQLQPGDRVVFLQGHQRWVYELTTRPRIIEASESWVLDPLPGRRLTLTTCWPKYGSSKRMYVRGTLVAPVAPPNQPASQGTGPRPAPSEPPTGRPVRS